MKWKLNGGYKVETSSLAAKKRILGGNPPPSVLAADDLKVIGSYRAATNLGILYHKSFQLQAAIIRVLFPSLTGVEIPIKKLGEAGVNILF